jgi:phosphoribosyl-ATP pyrophosphohydrolase
MNADSLNIKSLIQSKNGVHISIYIPQPASVLNFKNFLDAALAKCTTQIGQSMSEEKIIEILGPIESLKTNSKMLSGFNSNIAIFRTSSFLRILSLPVDIDFDVHVADSFHVKPLLTYLNQDYQYLFFGSDGNKGYLYKGTKKSYNLLDEFYYHDDQYFDNDPNYSELTSDIKRKQYLIETNISWIEQVISTIDKDYSHDIFISANASETKILRKSLKNRRLHWRNVSRKYDPKKEKWVMETIQKTLDLEKTALLNISLNEFVKPHLRKLSHNRVSYDINEISKAAKKGHVKKLLIASDAFVFGKINEENGEVTLHEVDKDHTDDDLLDDIAQNVYKSGGEVLLIKKNSMPDNELIVGIINDFGQSNSNMFKKKPLVA